MTKYLLAVTFLLTGCSNYIENIHKGIDREEQEMRKKAKRERKPLKRRKPGVDNPQSLSLKGGDVDPRVERKYDRSGRYRTKAKDMVDSGSSGSLWTGKGKDNYLFEAYRKRRKGDIIVVNVQQDLRREISAELKRAFPEPSAQKKEEGTDEGAAAEGGEGDQAQAGGDEEEEKVYDKISTKIVEEINSDYFIIRGKKEVVFRKEKRTFEVQALIPKRNISNDDTVNSDAILESRVYVYGD